MDLQDKKFIIRTYTKAELAHLYNPHLCLKAALQVLRRWILFNELLFSELTATGYRARNRILSPRQVEIIVRYLGAP